MNKPKKYDVVVVGGGPSGMMAAITAKKQHPTSCVLLIEKNKQCGNKLLLTGGGRCNLTADVSHEEIITCCPKNGRFLFSALEQFDAQSIQKFFGDNGCSTVIEEHHRVFPASMTAHHVLSTMIKVLTDLEVELKMSCEVFSCDPDLMTLETSHGLIAFSNLILATGGVTFTQTGSDGKGHEILRNINHHVTTLKPCEVPLVSQDGFIQEKILQGLSFKNVLLTVVSGKKKHQFKHDLLITHFGLSGPAALRSSFEVSKVLENSDVALVKVDFIPGYDLNRTDQTLSELKEAYSIPKRLIDYLETSKGNKTILELLKNFEVNIHQTKGFATAFVTNGGLSIKEVNPKTMKSKQYPWLSVCGELLDVNGYTGGYNLTIAFSTGYCAGYWSL